MCITGLSFTVPSLWSLPARGAFKHSSERKFERWFKAMELSIKSVKFFSVAMLFTVFRDKEGYTLYTYCILIRSSSWISSWPAGGRGGFRCGLKTWLSRLDFLNGSEKAGPRFLGFLSVV
jgi:hypothetical protein